MLPCVVDILGPNEPSEPVLWNAFSCNQSRLSMTLVIGHAFMQSYLKDTSSNRTRKTQDHNDRPKFLLITI